uniref:Uncharacterized protein n=1 Tax=Anguilla anguilla TaxID=7936 RepID=A0A0E9X933_ANGAN
MRMVGCVHSLTSDSLVSPQKVFTGGASREVY